MADNVTTTHDAPRPEGAQTTPVQPEGTGPRQEPGGRTYTEAEIGRLLAAERERIRNQYADYDQLKGQLTELQGTLQDKDKTLEQKEQALGEFQQLQAQWEEERAVRDLRDQVIEQARAAGFRVPTDAYALLDMAEATAEPDKIGQLVAKLAEDRPDLLGQRVPGTGATQPRRSGQPEGETREQRLQRLGLRPGASALFEGGGVMTPPGFEEA